MIENKFLVIVAALFILAAIPVTVYLVSIQRDQRSNAAEVTATNSAEANKIPVAKEVFDLNGDGRVNSLDLKMVTDKWGDKTKPIEDINQDGNVDIQDVRLVVDHWK